MHSIKPQVYIKTITLDIPQKLRSYLNILYYIPKYILKSNFFWIYTNFYQYIPIFWGYYPKMATCVHHPRGTQVSDLALFLRFGSLRTQIATPLDPPYQRSRRVRHKTETVDLETLSGLEG